MCQFVSTLSFSGLTCWEPLSIKKYEEVKCNNTTESSNEYRKCGWISGSKWRHNEIMFLFENRTLLKQTPLQSLLIYDVNFTKF